MTADADQQAIDGNCSHPAQVKVLPGLWACTYCGAPLGDP